MAAGLIGAEFGNEYCSAGVAYNTTLVALKALILPSKTVWKNSLPYVTYAREQIPAALEYNRDKIDVYANCYTFDDKYKDDLAISAVLEKGIRLGRNGKGNIFVFSAGNRGNNLNDCNMNLFATSIHAITITSVGKEGASPDFAIPCACSLASTYGIYTTHEGDRKLLTTTHDDECANFDGTSASAALASGIIALTLQANPALTWRDVQHLIVLTSSHDRLTKNETIQNAKGLLYSPYFGFGIMNASAMVAMARNWTIVPQQINTCASNHRIKYAPYNTKDISWNMTDSRIKSLEHVTVTLIYNTSDEDSIKMILCSPKGTCCNILHNNTSENKRKNEISWTYMTVSFWGESSQGEWNLSIIEYTGTMESKSNIRVKEATLNMYGTGDYLNESDSRCVNEGDNEHENSEGRYTIPSDEGEKSTVKTSSSSLEKFALLSVSLLIAVCVAILFFM